MGFTQPIRSTMAQIVDYILQLQQSSVPRIIIGITGVPGAGKSTLAQKIVNHFNAIQPQTAAYLPMDGFHKSNAQLQQQGQFNRKGAIDTFNVDGYLEILENIKHNQMVKAPEYCRKIHDIVPESILIDKQQLIITEGIFLLANEGNWSKVRSYLDYCIFLEEDDEILHDRLIQRQMNKGITREAAQQHFNKVDGPNIQFVRSIKSSDCEVFYMEELL